MKAGKLADVSWQDRFEHQKAVLFDESELQSSGSRLQVIKIPQGHDIKPHFHKIRTEAFYVLQGSGIIVLNDKEFSCSPHDYFLCDVGDIHAFSNPHFEDFIIGIFRTNDPGDSDMHWVTAGT